MHLGDGLLLWYSRGNPPFRLMNQQFSLTIRKGGNQKQLGRQAAKDWGIRWGSELIWIYRVTVHR